VVNAKSDLQNIDKGFGRSN